MPDVSKVIRKIRRGDFKRDIKAPATVQGVVFAVFVGQPPEHQVRPDLARSAKGLGYTEEQPHPQLSSPAKAGDPVFQRRLRFLEGLRRTGSPAFAGDDSCV